MVRDHLKISAKMVGDESEMWRRKPDALLLVGLFALLITAAVYLIEPRSSSISLQQAGIIVR